MDRKTRNKVARETRMLFAPYHAMIGVIIALPVLFMTSLSAGIDPALMEGAIFNALGYLVAFNIAWLVLSIIRVRRSIKQAAEDQQVEPHLSKAKAHYGKHLHVDESGMIVVRSKKAVPPKPTGNLKTDYLNRRAYMATRLDEMEETDPSLARSGRRILGLVKKEDTET